MALQFRVIPPSPLLFTTIYPLQGESETRAGWRKCGTRCVGTPWGEHKATAGHQHTLGGTSWTNYMLLDCRRDPKETWKSHSQGAGHEPPTQKLLHRGVTYWATCHYTCINTAQSVWGSLPVRFHGSLHSLENCSRLERILTDRGAHSSGIGEVHCHWWTVLLGRRATVSWENNISLNAGWKGEHQSKNWTWDPEFLHGINAVLF